MIQDPKEIQDCKIYIWHDENLHVMCVKFVNDHYEVGFHLHMVHGSWVVVSHGKGGWN